MITSRVEQEWITITIGRTPDAADKERMVADLNNALGLAFKASDGLCQERTPAETSPGRDRRELVGCRVGKVTRVMVLLYGQDIDGKPFRYEKACP